MPTELTFATNAEAVDVSWLFTAIKGSYWGQHYTFNSLVRATERSLCFSAFTNEGHEQVAFARVLTDGNLTSVLNDVIVDPRWRGKGIGTRLLQQVFAHKDVRETICILQARPENFGLYAKIGFVPVGSIYKRDPQ